MKMTELRKENDELWESLRHQLNRIKELEKENDIWRDAYHLRKSEKPKTLGRAPSMQERLIHYLSELPQFLEFCEKLEGEDDLSNIDIKLSYKSNRRKKWYVSDSGRPKLLDIPRESDEIRKSVDERLRYNDLIYDKDKLTHGKKALWSE